MLAGTAPVADDLTVNTNEDTSVNGTVTATDVDLEPLTFSLAAAPSIGGVVVNGDGTFTYTPDADANGVDTFTVDVTDGDLTDTAIVTVNIAPVNDAPTTSPIFLNARQGETITFQIPGNDVDGDTLSYTPIPAVDVGQISDISFSLTTGEVTFTVSQTAPSTIIPLGFTVTDGIANSTQELITVNVAPNTAPVASDAALSVSEDAANGDSVGSVSASDGEVDPLTYSIISGNGDGIFAIDSNTGEITVADNANLDFETTSAYSLQVEVSDGILTDTATVDIAVTDVVESTTLEVDIDLISLYGGPAFSSWENYGALLIEGDTNFDVNDIDLDSLGFGATGGEDSLVTFWGHAVGFIADVDSDGDSDLVLLIDLSDLDASGGWNTLTLTGQLDNGTQITGTTNEYFFQHWWSYWC